MAYNIKVYIKLNYLRSEIKTEFEPICVETKYYYTYANMYVFHNNTFVLENNLAFIHFHTKYEYMYILCQ